MKKLLYILFILLAFACETEISPVLNDAEEIMVIDAWLNQKMEKQEIRITRSQAYFDNAQPATITGLEVNVEDLNTGEVFNFQEGENAYFWDPVDKPFGEIEHTYRLTVYTHDNIFEAVARLGRVPEVDSIVFHYNQKDFNIAESYYSAEFIARDPVGVGDAYWIKAWKNGSYLGRPSEINIAFDAGLSPGQPVDGQVFHQVVRRDFVNPLEERSDKANYYHPPYTIGDSLFVEIHSISPAAFDYLSAVILQTNRPGGFSELFATPLTNVPTNIKSTVRMDTEEKSTVNVAGFFNVSAVSSGGGKISQEIAQKAKVLAGE
ncbi:hypothetical protein OKW21_003187 [Catalinimonas alkaloidigena]|uniref:DUF4249 family protein n=1 Tax=Catalinimonas alkaloidigena TaxID=1075417 RepID=UPI00240770C6|nr:DUF4249 family protein [Catalinimonas alkaloidigena]MDF9797924.1 hypothetical protein [Catalinimonas alkaloidigena]